MKVALIRVDGKFPNLALMKLSSWHKKRGDDVVLIDLSDMKFDRIYASQVFAGGSGYDLEAKLPDEIEHCKPDYDLFNTDFSMGFTSRGCVRNCKFCIVRRKEGEMKEHSPLSEFVDDRFQKVILMDNSFLASPKCKEKLQRIISKKWKVNFSQGLDLRLINNENAKLLSRVKFYNWTFSRRLIHFAWDNIEEERKILRGLKILLSYIPSHCIMVYVLVGFNTTLKDDLYRIRKLADLKVKPFVMICNNGRDPTLRHLSRWVNKRYYIIVPWKNYLETKISVKKKNRKS
jgi:radical SAM superfamily enzyme YgiQ (UPF0313 family)